MVINDRIKLSKWSRETSMERAMKKEQEEENKREELVQNMTNDELNRTQKEKYKVKGSRK